MQIDVALIVHSGQVAVVVAFYVPIVCSISINR